MKAVILAAGYGTRMYPLTKDTPKALLEIGGKTILERTLEKLETVESVDKIYLITNNKFFQIFDEWLASYNGKEVVLVNDGTNSDEERLGSLGDLEFAVNKEGIQDDVLVLCSDRLFDFSLKEFCSYFHEKGSIVNACFDLGEKPKIRGKYGCVVLDNGRITSFEEKPEDPKSSIISVAFYIFPKETLHFLGEYPIDGKKDTGYFLEWLVGRSEVHGFLFSGRNHDVGSLETYEKLKTQFFETKA